MNTHASLPIVAALMTLIPTLSPAQVPPPDLRAAARARSDAIARADAATWDRLTADSFTVTFPNGAVVTKADRIPQIKAQQPTQPLPFENEHYQSVRNGFVHRYRSGGIALMEVWTKERSGWRVAAIQVATVDLDSATMRRMLDSADAAFAAALMRGDQKALAAYYADDAILLGTGMKAVVGRAAIEQTFAGFVGMFTISNARLQTTDVVINGDLVTVVGTYSMTLHPKSGTGADLADSGKFLTVWERVGDGSWKILRDCSNSDRPAM